uniref:Uncharacterized protein n=1 Tax=Anguilla anguilla TaxID=7936 RepID=A0A0E9VLT7_ANGAN
MFYPISAECISPTFKRMHRLFSLITPFTSWSLLRQEFQARSTHCWKLHFLMFRGSL